MKCSCGVELFDNDIVDSIIWVMDGEHESVSNKVYRCPKCFTTIKEKNE